MKFSLVVNQGSQQGKVLPIARAEFSIGRDAKCNLRPASQHVSKKHCVFHIRGEQVYLEDCGSTNGTFVNEQPLKGECELHDGDRLKVGPLDFIIKLEPAQVEKPTHVERETQVPAVTAAAPPAPRPPVRPAAPKPAPARAPEPKNHENLDDDAIGSMLLSLSDDDASGPADEGDSFSTGSTLMQVLKPEEMEQLQKANDEKTPYRPQAAKAAGDANSSNAAKAILEKYRKRPKA